jgi:hypothetical protein
MIIGNSPDYCSWDDRANSFDNKSRVTSKLEGGLGKVDPQHAGPSATRELISIHYFRCVAPRFSMIYTTSERQG